MTPERTAKYLLRNILAQKNKNQSWLARKMRTHETTISAVLAGRRRPTPAFVASLREITGLDLDTFPKTKDGKIRPRAAEDEADAVETVGP